MRAILAGAVLLAACSRPATSPADDLVVTAEVTPATVRAADKVTVGVAITNQGRQPRTIDVGLCTPPFAVIDQSGTFIGPRPSQNCALILALKELAPGERYVFPAGQWTADVPPDSYVLYGRVLARGAIVASQPVPITVTPYVASP